MKEFGSGATRTDEAGKIDPEGALSPLVIEAYCEYIARHRVTESGVRSMDNWQKGMSFKRLARSAWRHFLSFWKSHRRGEPDLDSALATMFNLNTYVHQLLVERQLSAELGMVVAYDDDGVLRRKDGHRISAM